MLLTASAGSLHAGLHSSLRRTCFLQILHFCHRFRRSEGFKHKTSGELKLHFPQRLPEAEGSERSSAFLLIQPCYTADKLKL